MDPGHWNSRPARARRKIVFCSSYPASVNRVDICARSQIINCMPATKLYALSMNEADAILGTPVEVFTRMMFTHIIQKLSAFLAKSDFTISEIAALHIVGRGEGLSVQSLGGQLNLSVSATS